MKLSQQMVGLFCASLSSSPLQRWVLLPGTTDVSIRVAAQRSAEPGQPNGVVLTAATSIWLPVPANHAFAFLRDESARSQVRLRLLPLALRSPTEPRDTSPPPPPPRLMLAP
jgi:homeobox-leucine zipper protein